MRIATVLRAGLAAAFLLSAPAMATPPADDVARFTALERVWLAAIAAHDTRALDRLLAPDFVDTTWNGRTRDKAAVLAAARDKGLAHGSQTLNDIAVRRYGDVAVVTGLDVSARGRVRFTDVFIRRADRWQAVNAQETPVR